MRDVDENEDEEEGTMKRRYEEDKCRTPPRGIIHEKKILL